VDRVVARCLEEDAVYLDPPGLGNLSPRESRGVGNERLDDERATIFQTLRNVSEAAYACSPRCLWVQPLLLLLVSRHILSILPSCAACSSRDPEPQSAPQQCLRPLHLTLFGARESVVHLLIQNQRVTAFRTLLSYSRGHLPLPVDTLEPQRLCEESVKCAEKDIVILLVCVRKLPVRYRQGCART
jgi:hypothetical protein